MLFFIDDFARALVIEGGVRDRIYYAFARRGIEIPFPVRTVVLAPTETKGGRGDAVRRQAAAIAAVPLMDPLPADARAVLVERAAMRTYGPGENHRSPG